MTTETAQQLPPGLDAMPPGPALEAALAGLAISRLANEDVGVALRARYRQKCYTDAMTLRLIYEAGQCEVVLNPDRVIGRKSEPDEFSADEARWLLAWTSRKASHEWGLAVDLITRLSRVLDAMVAVACDQPRAKVFSDWLVDLTSEQEQAILDELLPLAGELTTSQLRDRIRTMAIAVDAEWAERRYRATVRGRDVSGQLDPDGSGTITGSRLPADRAAAGCERVARIARRLKSLGATRTRAQLRADLFLGLLDGVFDGLTEDQIIALMLDGDDLPDGDANTGAGGADGGVAPAGGGRSPEGVEIRVEVATLLGLNEHPGQLPGSGPVPASVARRLVRRQLRAEWRWGVVDAEGRLLTEGVTRRRPTGWHGKRGSARRGIVELQIPAVLLDLLISDGPGSGRAATWWPVLTDIAAQHGAQRGNGPAPAPPPPPPCPADPGGRDTEDVGGVVAADLDDVLCLVPDTVPDELALPEDHEGPLTGAKDPRRFPGAAVRRRTEIRERSCYVPTCRVPAGRGDKDHLVDHRYGGRTTHTGLGVGCRHDHRARHAGAIWHQTGHGGVGGDGGVDLWITGRTGHLMAAQPPPIIEPLPDPIPRDHDPWPADDPGLDDPVPGHDVVWDHPGNRSPPRNGSPSAPSGPAAPGPAPDDCGPPF